MLFGVSNFVGPWNIVLDGIPDPHSQWERNLGEIFQIVDHYISPERLKLET